MSINSSMLHKLVVKKFSGLKTPVAAENQMYYAGRVQARKDWDRLHAAPEPGMGLDGRPLQRGKAVTHDDCQG